jgi:hypothetical protein
MDFADTTKLSVSAVPAKAPEAIVNTAQAQPRRAQTGSRRERATIRRDIGIRSAVRFNILGTNGT